MSHACIRGLWASNKRNNKTDVLHLDALINVNGHWHITTCLLNSLLPKAVRRRFYILFTSKQFI